MSKLKFSEVPTIKRRSAYSFIFVSIFLQKSVTKNGWSKWVNILSMSTVGNFNYFLYLGLEIDP